MPSPTRSSEKSRSRSRTRSPKPASENLNIEQPTPLLDTVTDQVEQIEISKPVDEPSIEISINKPIDEPSAADINGHATVENQISGHNNAEHVVDSVSHTDPQVDSTVSFDLTEEVSVQKLPAEIVPDHSEIAVEQPDQSEIAVEQPDTVYPTNPINSTFGGLYEDDITGDEIQITLQSGLKTKIAGAKNFEDLNLPEPILKGIYDAGFNVPSIIQAKALPLLLASPPTNMIAQSRSGTGKTAAFALTMIYRCDPTVPVPQAICLANTRELALQIVQVIQSLGKHTGLSVIAGIPQGVQRGHRISQQIVVGTPGTVLDLCRRRQLALDKVRVLVLDEADAMLDTQNLLEQSFEVRKMMPQNPQVLLFSATFPNKVKDFSAMFAPQANILMLPREEVNVKAIHQFFLRVNGPNAKFEKLTYLYALLSVGQSLIFVQKRKDAYMLRDRLTQEGHAATVITGDDSPIDRDRVMAEFRSGHSKVLIATNVLARGIDVPQINLVVNYDMPVDARGYPDHEAYMHRVGRTGRFGRQGVSVNFIDGLVAEEIQQLVISQYALEIQEMPEDYVEMESMLKACRV